MGSSRTKHILIAFLCALSVCRTATAAATYPVQAGIQVRHPSVWLDDYSQGFDERVSVVLLNRDALSAGLDVRLRITVSCPGGVTLRTKPSAVFSPVTLYAGMPERLSMAELAPYFLPQNLDITGRLENGALPEGPAKFTVEALEYHTGVQVSLPGVTIASLSVQKPPVLLFPQNGGTVRYMEPLSLMFRWNTLSTTLNRQQPYQFILKEIADAGANATSAFNYSQPVYETETYANTLIYGVAEPPLEAGKTYGWAVRSQEPHCLNGGWSEVFTFTLDTLKGVGGTVTDTVRSVSGKVSRAAACGEDNYRVTNLTPAESLSVGDTITVGGGFKVRVTELIPSGSGYSGAGLMFIPYIGVDFAVTLHSVAVNTDKQLINGYTEVVHDESNAQIGGTDALLYGGTTKLKNGVVLPDVEADFQFPVPVAAALDTVKNTIVFYNADGTAAGSVTVPLNDAGEPVFPVKVKDADGRMVQIDEAGEDDGDSNGERPLTVTELGTETDGDYIPERMLCGVRSDIGEVEFLDSDGSQYSFDSPLPYYESVAVLLNSDGSNGGRVYRKAEPDYQVQWKFMETGATDKVRARLTLTKEGREEIRQPERMVFKTPAESGSVTLPSEYNPADGTYTVTVTGTQPDTKQTVLALYPYSGTYFCLGMLDIDTRQRKTAKVCLVNLGGDYERSTIESGINNIYNKAGISWQVTEEVDFTYPQDSLALLFDTKESGGPLYSQRQKSLNAAFATYMAERYDSGTCYLFLYSNPKGSKSRDVAGYMPRGGQFGYINTARLSQAELPAVAAHELGHGRFRLRHIFDGDYGTVASRQKGRTDNLMDYTSSPYKSTHIAKWQWNQIYNPALLTEVWERDEDSEWVVQAVQCLTGAAIDVVINYGFKWAELLMDGYPVVFTDYEKIFSEMNTAEVVTSAGVACVTSVIPSPVDKSKANLIASFSAALGAGATAVAANLETQYNDIQRQYPDKSFNEVLSAVNWAEVLKNVGVQAVISGIATSVTIYATTHPKFIAFKDNLKKIGYAALHKRLVKAGLDDSAIDEFCKKFGISPDKADDIAALSESREILRGGAHSKLCNDPDVLEQVTKFRKIEGREKFGFDDDFLANAKGGAGLSYSELLNTCERFMSSVNKYNISIGEFDKVVSDLQKGGGFSVGSEWVMRYIAENGAELSGRNLRFEVVEAIEDESRNLIRRIDVEEIIGKTKIFYEFKSVKDIPPVNFYEQFGKDLMLDDVTSLDQIKWIFDGRKVTQRQLTENITNAIKQWNVPDRVLRKWDAENKKSDFIQRLLDVVNTIFKSK